VRAQVRLLTREVPPKGRRVTPPYEGRKRVVEFSLSAAALYTVLAYTAAAA